MICDDALARIDAFLDGTLEGAVHEEMRRHLARCEECRDLVAALGAAREGSEEPGLAEAIVARTSGSPCASARARLCARIDGELDPIEVELVDGHLDGCVDCAAVARALVWAADRLPSFGELDPGPGFTELVLARTTGDPRRISFGARLAGALARLLDRPRVAWEGAFVATVVLCLPVLAPGSPLAELPREFMSELRGTINGIEARVKIGATDVWASTGALALEDSTELATGLARDLRVRLGTFPDAPASGQTRDEGDPTEPRFENAQEVDRR